MPIAMLDRERAVAPITPLPELVIRRETRAEVMAALQSKPEAEMTRRFHEGHHAYVAWHAGEPAAWGWVATKTARIGELDFTFSVAGHERYLWNFVTLPAYRGRGIYPRVLDAIIIAEADATRFWVAYAPENRASGAGIRKAGFVDVAELSFDEAARAAVHDIVAGGAKVASALLGLRTADDGLAHCWRCAAKAAPNPAGCYSGPCCCDYQRPATECAEPSAA